MAQLSKAIDVLEECRMTCHWCRKEPVFIAKISNAKLGQSCMEHRTELWELVSTMKATARDKEHADMVKWELLKDQK